jgi:TPR repeat protein
MNLRTTAAHELEHLYSDGVNTVQTEMDYRNGINQLETAARAGHGKAALFLSQLYHQGFRVERDLQKAQYWQDLAYHQA